MIYYCEGCRKNYEDSEKEIEIVEYLEKSKSGELPGWCQGCGAILVPGHFSEGERTGVFTANSKCPNARFCCEDSVYRSECEKMVFYPGCLNYLFHEINTISRLLKKQFHFSDEDLLDMVENLNTNGSLKDIPEKHI